MQSQLTSKGKVFTEPPQSKLTFKGQIFTESPQSKPLRQLGNRSKSEHTRKLELFKPFIKTDQQSA